MVTINYADIFDSCEQMTAYEGRRAYDANGENMFSEVHLTAQEKPLVKDFARQVCDLMATALDYIITDTNETDTEYSFEWKEDKSLVIRTNAVKDMEAVVSSYVMWQWLAPRLPDRAEAWRIIHEGQFKTLPRIWYRLKPTL